MIYFTCNRCKSNKIMFITLYFFMIFFQQVKNEPKPHPESYGDTVETRFVKLECFIPEAVSSLSLNSWRCRWR